MKPEEIQKLVVTGNRYDSINTDKSIEIGRANDIEGFSYTIYHEKNPYVSGENLTVIDLYDGWDNIIIYVKAPISFKEAEDYIQYFQDDLIKDRGDNDMEFQFRSPDLFKMWIKIYTFSL